MNMIERYPQCYIVALFPFCIPMIGPLERKQCFMRAAVDWAYLTMDQLTTIPLQHGRSEKGCQVDRIGQ